MYGDWQWTRATAPNATLHPLLYRPAEFRRTARPTRAARGARAVVWRRAVAHIPRRALGSRLGHRMRGAYQRSRVGLPPLSEFERRSPTRFGFGTLQGRSKRYGRRRRVPRPAPPIHSKGVAVLASDLLGLGHTKALFEMMVVAFGSVCSGLEP